MGFPSNRDVFLEFFERNLLSLDRLIFPFDNLMPAGANFRALDKLDFETPKMDAISLALRVFAEPCASAFCILLL